MPEDQTPVEYKPYEERTPDDQYQKLLGSILRYGTEAHPIQGGAARMLVGPQLRYPIENGFPVITERDISGFIFRSALAEHIAFLNGARTQEELESFGVTWWARWLEAEHCAIFGLEPGDMGDGSYGAAWRNFPTAEGEPFDQIYHVLKQMKERPYLRTHRITTWTPQYTLQHEGLTRKVVVAPCHGDVHMLMFPETQELVLHHFQRSGDLPVGVPANIIQYAAFGLMVAQHTGYKLKEIVYTFSDAHIYEEQYPYVEEMIARTPKKLGTVALSAIKDDIWDYRPDDFQLTDYNPHPVKTRIPTPL